MRPFPFPSIGGTFILSGLEHYGFDSTSVWLVIILAAVLHDDLTCITVGLYISSETLSAGPAIAACCIGTLLGDLGWFFAGRYVGAMALTVPPLRWMIKEEQLYEAKAMFRRYGARAIVLSRFLPGLRTPVQIAAGIFYDNVSKACLYFFLAAIAYAPILVGASAIFGTTLDVKTLYEQYGKLAPFFVVVMLWALFWILKFLWRRAAHDSD